MSDCPGDNVVVLDFTSVNTLESLPVIRWLEIVNDARPVFEIVIDCSEALPAPTDPKSSDSVLDEITATTPPMPASAMFFVGAFVALLTILNWAFLVPADAG